jgi:hypothetical protein
VNPDALATETDPSSVPWLMVAGIAAALLLVLLAIQRLAKGGLRRARRA